MRVVIQCCEGRPYHLGVAEIGAHALAAPVDIPHLDLTVQPSGQQQVTGLWEKSDCIDALHIGGRC